MNLFDKLYDSIAEIGNLPKNYAIALFKRIAKIVKNVFKFNKSSFSSAKIFFKRAVIALLIAGVVIGTGYTAISNSNRVDAVCIKIGDDVIGYTNSQTEADIAKAYALKVLGSEDFSQITDFPAKTQSYNLKTATTISDLIVKNLGKDMITAYEVYIDDEFIGAVENPQKARDGINNIYNLAKKLYPDSTVSFSQGVKLIKSIYPADSEKLLTIAELQSVLNKKLTILYAQCEKSYSDTAFETVEVQTNKLFMGDSRIRRAGANGKEYNIKLVTYIDNQKVYSEELMSYPIQQPVTQIVERGIRANSLSMGSYTVIQTTGMFCWPVVELYKVTSPYGSRSLGYHKGIDISGPAASGKLVVAGATGTVTEAGWNTGGYGYYVVINHGNGVETLYAHMLENSIMVNPGDVVQKGQTIGRVGNTGYSFGAHLHFEVRVNGMRLDPAPFLGLQ